MKRIILVLMFSVMLGACGESTTDVATTGGGRGDTGFVPPDTVIEGPHGTLNAYKPGSPVAIAFAGELTARAPFAGAVAAAADNGYGFDPTTVTVAMGHTEDGRDVWIAIAALSGAEPSGFLYYARIGEVERVVPARTSVHGGGGFDVMDPAVKTGDGPAKALPPRCVGAAIAAYNQCYDAGCSCWFTCLTRAVAAFYDCLVATIMS